MAKMIVVLIVVLIAMLTASLAIFFLPSVVAETDCKYEDLPRLEEHDLLMTINFERSRVRQVVATVAEVTGLEIEVHGPDPGPVVSIVMQKVTVLDVLTKLGCDHGLEYLVTSPGRLVVTIPESEESK